MGLSIFLLSVSRSTIKKARRKWEAQSGCSHSGGPVKADKERGAIFPIEGKGKAPPEILGHATRGSRKDKEI